MMETIRLGKRAKNQLVSLKKRTGIENWNILCRWAFIVSLAESGRPRAVTESVDDGIEMTWRTFSGDYGGIYEALLKMHCTSAGQDTDPQSLNQQLRGHINRGIGYLMASRQIGNIADLAELAIQKQS